ncbi:MAG: hypothetical protein CMI02_11845 [Oceanospirillaceae bacterium]|nr:hypothetical protein [Oceanospirillaceae bacterium]MBT12711.1 hypothetical protein [Oceanospirillaceae bacterium]|tara:strand:- start:108690 stop:109031 length:342 start_codon:yes stop_codon:yes gene_type:complete
MNPVTKQEVEAIFLKQTGLRPEELFPSSRLEQDCGITGDDAWELLEAIQEKFGTDLSDLDFELYFHGEAEGLLSRLLNRSREKHRLAFPVTVNHLFQVVEKGKWFAPPKVRKI